MYHGRQALESSFLRPYKAYENGIEKVVRVVVEILMETDPNGVCTTTQFHVSLYDQLLHSGKEMVRIGY